MSLEDKGQPVYYVEYEEENWEGNEEELVDPPVFLRQLLDWYPVHGSLLYFVFEVILAHYLDIHAVLAGSVALFLEQDGGISADNQRLYNKLQLTSFQTSKTKFDLKEIFSYWNMYAERIVSPSAGLYC